MVWRSNSPSPTRDTNDDRMEDLRGELQPFLKQVVEESFRTLGERLIDELRIEMRGDGAMHYARASVPEKLRADDEEPLMDHQQSTLTIGGPSLSHQGSRARPTSFGFDRAGVPGTKYPNVPRIRPRMRSQVTRKSQADAKPRSRTPKKHMTISDVLLRSSIFTDLSKTSEDMMPVNTMPVGSEEATTGKCSTISARCDSARESHGGGEHGVKFNFEPVEHDTHGYALLSAREHTEKISEWDEEERGQLRDRDLVTCRFRVQTLVSHQLFEHCIGFVVGLNALMLGVETDYQSCGGAGPRLSVVLNGSELFFCLIFLAELGLRLFAHRFEFFAGESWAWNIFDLTAVTLQVIEQFVHMLLYMNIPMSESFINFMRALHLVRILRLVRLVKLVEELGTIASSIMASLTALCWTLLLLFMLMYIVSVIFTQIIVEGLPADSQHAEAIKYWYGRLPRSLLTMFEVIAGGVSWDEVVTPLIEDISPAVGVIFCFYVAFCVFAMLNMATGVFVDKAIRKAQDDTDTYTANHISDVFFNDAYGADGVTLAQFNEKMDTQEMQEYFKSINVDPSEAKTLFGLLDSDGSGLLNPEELVQGCLRLRGGAKALDLQVLMTLTQRMSSQLLENQRQLIGDITRLTQDKGGIQRQPSPERDMTQPC